MPKRPAVFLTVERFPKPQPSFAGGNAVVLVVLAFVGAIVAVLAPILQNACIFGCPQ